MQTTMFSAKDFVSCRSAWGKAVIATGQTHHLAHHSADVAVVILAILAQPIWAARASAALGRQITSEEAHCLSALAFLHDIGKLAPGFQAKAWPLGHGQTLRGHLECGYLWMRLERKDALAGAVSHFAHWPGLLEWFAVIFAHHGRPVPEPEGGVAQQAFPLQQEFPFLRFYDWQREERIMGQALINWFPEIASSSPPKPHPPFLHYFCGLLNLVFHA
jgi:CRISPR-associated endonuclease/helicase Cas3